MPNSPPFRVLYGVTVRTAPSSSPDQTAAVTIEGTPHDGAFDAAALTRAVLDRLTCDDTAEVQAAPPSAAAGYDPEAHALGVEARAFLATLGVEVSVAPDADLSTREGLSRTAQGVQTAIRRLRADLAESSRAASAARSLLAAIGIAGGFDADKVPPDGLPEAVRTLAENAAAAYRDAGVMAFGLDHLRLRLHPGQPMPDTVQGVVAEVDEGVEALRQAVADAEVARADAERRAETAEAAADESADALSRVGETLRLLRASCVALGLSEERVASLTAGHSVAAAAEDLRAKLSPAVDPTALVAPLRGLVDGGADLTPEALVAAVVIAMELRETTAKVSEAAARKAEKRAGEVDALVAPLRSRVPDGDKLDPQSLVALAADELAAAAELAEKVREAAAKGPTHARHVAELTEALKAATDRAEHLAAESKVRGDKLDALTAEVADQSEAERALVAPLRGFVKPRADLDTLTPAAVVAATVERFEELAAMIEEIRAGEPPGVDLAAVQARDGAPVAEEPPFDADGLTSEPYHGDDAAEDPAIPAVSPELAAWEASIADLTEGGSVVRLWRARRAELQALGETDARSAWCMAVAKTEALGLPEGWLNRAVRAADTAAAADAPAPILAAPAPVQGALPGTVEEVDDGSLSLEALKAKRDGVALPSSHEKAPSGAPKAADAPAPLPVPPTPSEGAPGADKPYDGPTFDLPPEAQTGKGLPEPETLRDARFFKEVIERLASADPTATVADLTAWCERHKAALPALSRVRPESLANRVRETCVGLRLAGA